MFCPRCAKKFESDTSFCRNCGLALDEVLQILNGEAETEPEFRRRPNFGLMQAGIAIFILGMVVALGNAALSTALGFRPDAGKVIFLSMIAVGMLLLGLGFVFPQKRYTKRRKNISERKDVNSEFSTAALPDRLIEPNDTPIEIHFPKEKRELQNAETSSVTEHTTRQLG